MGKVIIVGMSPFHDTTVAAGTFTSGTTPAAREAIAEMEYRGFITEVVPLQKATEMPTVCNDED